MMELRCFYKILSAVWACLSTDLHPFIDTGFTHPLLAELTLDWIQDNAFTKAYELIFYMLLLVF
jgi:hypothetical protein